MKFGRKISGGKYHASRKKKKHELDTQTNYVKLGNEKKKTIKIRSRMKTILLTANTANVLDPKTNKTTKVKILNVTETPANRFLSRQNILMKSSIIETEKGKARITNRPGREASVEAILLEK